MRVQNIQPFLWYDTHALEAAEFYVSIFPNSKINAISYYGEGAPHPAGSVMTVGFELDGLHLMALNGGPHFKFTEAISFLIAVDTQEELDHLWDNLASGGEPGQCGWLKDKYGLSWQLTPSILGTFLTDPNRQKAGNVMKAMLGMRRIDIGELQAAFDAV
jgi:predicted 3-demethylubiquinone-9 3-methyltransferase (glyoxalase superfamily)